MGPQWDKGRGSIFVLQWNTCLSRKIFNNLFLINHLTRIAEPCVEESSSRVDSSYVFKSVLTGWDHNGSRVFFFTSEYIEKIKTQFFQKPSEQKN